ncbi:hypothetical protein CLV63_12913 [Murinocardiopsis flavida]|uniref:Uncharacterized protein n=1 Tax=Murinocardiopsis flavida TaxID=645275 RepID=A0A2P8CUU2_9ACTN|nr:hypothetical protein [Murinocardiopsis flavida]PSK88727.1 hypothetical protein CLV63_12913 [Murinocardiopsis flavida]
MIAVVGAIVGALALTILSDMISKEARTRLDQIPQALVKLAARRLPANVRRDDERAWLADLHEFLHGDAATPITRLTKGTYFAACLFWGAHQITEIEKNTPGTRATPAEIESNRIKHILIIDELAHIANQIVDLENQPPTIFGSDDITPDTRTNQVVRRQPELPKE